jgi:hypothetical protein
MKKIILLSLLISGCNPVIQNNVVNKVQQNIPKPTVSSVQNQQNNVMNNTVSKEEIKNATSVLNPQVVTSNKPITDNTTLGVKITENEPVPIATPSPTPSIKPTPIPKIVCATSEASSCIDISVISENPIDFRDKPFGYYSDPNFNYVQPYSRAEPLPVGILDGSISLIFKDEYKIRLKSHLEKVLSNYKIIKTTDMLDEFDSMDENIRITKSNEIKQVNEILSKYKTISISGVTSPNQTEESVIEDEIQMSKIYKRDVANEYSVYNSLYKQTNLGEVITELRKIEIVRESNYNQELTND